MAVGGQRALRERVRFGFGVVVAVLAEFELHELAFGIELDHDHADAKERFAIGDLADVAKVADAVGRCAARLPTYITLKDVKKRWGHGQEDVYPVCQFEKLWGDMTAVPGFGCGFVAVPRARGQQLKDPAQLDGWLRDGSAAHVEALGRFAD